MKVVNSTELEDTFPGWYNPPYCLATWPLGNNSTVCCQSNASTQTRRALRDAAAPALARSSHRRVGARENTKLKLLRPAHSLTHSQSSITLNWFPSATNGEGVSLFIYVRLNLEGREKWREIERQVHKKWRNPILCKSIIATQRYSLSWIKIILPQPWQQVRYPAHFPFKLHHTQMQSHTEVRTPQGSSNTPAVS